MRRTTRSLMVGWAAVLLSTAASAGEIDPALDDVLLDKAPDDVVSTIVYMVDQADLAVAKQDLQANRALPALWNQVVTRELYDMAQATQAEILADLSVRRDAGLVERFEPFWIANMVRVDATPAQIREIAERNDVLRIYYNFEIEMIEPVDMDEFGKKKEPGPAAAGGAGDGIGGQQDPEPGLIAINAPAVWALGIDGTGVLVASLDTGVDGDHPALIGRWAGDEPAYAGNPEWALFDPVTSDTFPNAYGSHGTHTMGTILGSAAENFIGVAPGAKYIHCAVIDRVNIATTVADSIASFQWMVNPDGNMLTSWDVPLACCNSWGVTTGHGYPQCDETFWSFLDNCEDAGTVIVFAAGNEGTSGLRRPGDRATNEYRTFSVAAVNGNQGGWPIAGFSSRGPTNCTPSGSPAIKPDIAAPGVDVRSALDGGGYGTLSGTSMATPHITGVVALVRQACPSLSVADVKQIMYDTAFDLGAPGEDNDYGHGMVDALAAVNQALAMCGPGPPRADDLAYQVPVDDTTLLTMSAIDFDGEPSPPAITFEISSLPSGTLSDPGNAHVITAGDLPYTLTGGGNQVMYASNGGFWGNDSFQYIADDGGVPPDGGDSDPATISVLVAFAPPSITTPSIPDGYLDQAYVPFQMQADQGQPSLDWEVGGELEYEEIGLGSSLFQTVGVGQGWNADDNSWSFSLPFAFPFFGVDYTTVWASSNGLLNFGGGSSDYSNSQGELIDNTRIAVLWDDLRSDQGGDIHIDDTVAGEVTIRWDVVTYSGSNPCNFSATLFEDGRIRLNYGSGNTGLSPTIGVSAGDGVNYLLASYDGAGSLTNADTLEIFPPSPLPEGMSMSTTGVLAGTPSEFGTFTPKVRVTDSLGRSDLVQYTLIINEFGAPCLGDFDGSGDVGFSDVLAIIAAWGPCAGACPEDLSGNGTVDFADILALIAVWGACP